MRIIDALPRLCGKGIAPHLQHSRLLRSNRVRSQGNNARFLPPTRGRRLIRCAIALRLPG
jgi:hypothetical protein